MQQTKTSDLIFIGFFSVVVFFGAFFIFSSLNKKEETKKVSIRSLENVVNTKVNKRIKRLQGKGLLLKSKIVHQAESIKEDESLSVQKDASGANYKLDIYQKTDQVDYDAAPKTAAERALVDAGLEAGNLEDRQRLIQDYKQSLVDKARKEGWDIQINDDLEVVSVKKL